MKVWLITEHTTFKEDDKRKKFYDYLESSWRPNWEKVFEGVKHTHLGGWSDKPGWVMSVTEFESMEEFSKVWSNMDFQQGLLKLRNKVKSFNVRILRPTISV